jgi:hypothetical protein
MADKKLNIKVRTKGAKRAKKDLKGVEGGMKSLGKAAVKAGAAFFGARAIISGLQKAIELSGKMEGMTRGFNNLTKSAGFSAQTFNKLQKATDGTMSSMDLLTQANNAMLLGIFESEDQMAKMFDTAQRLAQALGKDAAFGIESLVTGMGRQSKLMLDNLGIMVKAEDAYKRYADELGTTASNLTDIQRKQAFVNEAMKEANKLVSTLGEEQLTTSDAINQAKTAFSDLAIVFGSMLTPKITEAADAMVRFAKALSDADLGKGQSTFSKWLDRVNPGFAKLIKQQKKYTKEVREQREEAEKVGAGEQLSVTAEEAERLGFLESRRLELRLETRRAEAGLLKEVYVPKLIEATEAEKNMAEFASQTAISLGTSAIMGDNVTESLKRAVIQLGLMVAQAKLFDYFMDAAKGFTPGGFLSTAVSFLFGKSPTQAFPSPNAGSSNITINQNFGGMGVIDHNYASNSIIPAINKAISTGQARIG